MDHIPLVGCATTYSTCFLQVMLGFSLIEFGIFRNRKYKILKVFTTLPDFPTTTDRELKAYQHLAAVHASHPGRPLIRELYDSFDIQGPFGKHNCLVLQPMHMTILEMMGLNPTPFDLPLLKMTVKRLLLALDFFTHSRSSPHWYRTTLSRSRSIFLRGFRFENRQPYAQSRGQYYASGFCGS